MDPQKGSGLLEQKCFQLIGLYSPTIKKLINNYSIKECRYGGRVEPRVGSGQTFWRQSRVGSGQRFGSGRVQEKWPVFMDNCDAAITIETIKFTQLKFSRRKWALINTNAPRRRTNDSFSRTIVVHFNYFQRKDIRKGQGAISVSAVTSSRPENHIFMFFHVPWIYCWIGYGERFIEEECHFNVSIISIQLKFQSNCI